MKVKEIIELLKTLNPEYEVVVGDSGYPSEKFTADSIKDIGDNTYVIY